MKNLFLNSTAIKVHPHNADVKGVVNSEKHQFVGTSRGRQSTKIHTIVDSIGNLGYFQLTDRDVQDSTVAVDILSHLDISDTTIQVDKTYEANKILNYNQQQDRYYIILLKSNTSNH